MKGNKGFTLIELIVVIAILGILVLLATPKLLNYTKDAELKQIQHDVKVMETEIGKELATDNNFISAWGDVPEQELLNYAQNGALYNTRGQVPLGSVDSEGFKVIPNEFASNINSSLGGAFYANDNGEVYYQHIKNLSSGEPGENSSGESGENQPNSAEIDGLIQEGYIPIANATELDQLRDSLTSTFGAGTEWEGEYTGGLDKEYVQVADIDLSGIANFNRIGNFSNKFTGEFDGQGFTIDNLTISRSSMNYVGLFGYTDGSTIKNVGLENVNVTGNQYVGGLVGRNDESSTVKNSYATGNVTGSQYVGGLVGMNHSSSTVEKSYTTGNVTGSSYVGGLVGLNNFYSTVKNSYATGDVEGSQYVGGLVGLNHFYSTVKNSYATGDVEGSQYVGGLVGQNQSSSTVENSYWDTETTGQESSAGSDGSFGKTTGEMKQKSTYNNWDFVDIWTIDESNDYPRLQWQK